MNESIGCIGGGRVVRILEPVIKEMYRKRLPALYQKLKG
jgi:hypothetical protein